MCLFCFLAWGYRPAMSNRPGPLAQKIAAELRAELGRQNHSKRWLAEQIGQNHVTVTRWINGDGPMSFEALDAMCEALGVTVGDVFVAAEHSTHIPMVRPTRSRTTTTVKDPDNAQGSRRDIREDVPLVAAA